MDDPNVAGRLTVTDHHGTILPLDLRYEDNDVVGEGFFLNPRRESLELLCRAKLTIAKDLLYVVRMHHPTLDFPLKDMQNRQLKFNISYDGNPTLTIDIYRSNPNRTVWNGRIKDRANNEEIFFLLEGFDSDSEDIRPIDLALIKWAISCGKEENDKRLGEFDKECQKTCDKEQSEGKRIKECNIETVEGVDGCKHHCDPVYL